MPLQNPHNKARHPIGIFDSGVGGLTVLREITRQMPQEDLVYFGDTARAPYGPEGRENVIRYSVENAIFLLEQDIKILVVACNTADSACAIEKLQKIFNIPVVGVIDPGVDKAVQTTKNQRIAVLGTRGTIASGAYQNKLKGRLPDALIFAVPCPLFVPLVEEGLLNDPVTDMVVQQYLKPLLGHGIDTLLLGCTHYPLLHKVIQKAVGNTVSLIDSGSTCAQRVQEILTSNDLHNPVPAQNGYRGKLQFFVSDDPQRFRETATQFLDSPIDTVYLKKPE